MDTFAVQQPTKRKKRADSPSSSEIVHGNKRSKAVIDLTLPLCTNCQTLDLDTSFDNAYAYYESAKDSSQNPESSLHATLNGTRFYNDAVLIHKFRCQLSRPSGCSLCEFFRKLRVQPGLHLRHKLLAFRCSDSWLFRADRLEAALLESYVNSVFMAVVPDVASIPPSAHEVNWLDYAIPTVGAIFRRPSKAVSGVENRNLLSARELNENYDLERLRTWLDVCRREHGNACKQRASQTRITRGFRLINCNAQAPVVEEKPWGTTYAALSYVWGSSAADLEDWPRTILDAVEVTRDLGLQYLWVYRLCINQNDLEEKNYLISRMTSIYEEADFTIVAAAGYGASHGLPWVRSTPRTPQPKYNLDSGSLLLSILRDPRHDVLESQYWTRGWTYQEGVLSNRRIVFTPFQTYWECRCMAIHESADLPLFHTPATQEGNDENLVMADFMLTGIFKGSAFSRGSNADQDDLLISRDENYRLDYGFLAPRELSIGAQLRGLNEHIREFSKRWLTDNADSLLAFQGVIGMYEQTSSLFLLHGLPIWTDAIAGTVTPAQITFALSVSSWYHRAQLSDRPMYISSPYRRQTHLPSWTWCGWSGTVTWRAPPDREHCAYMSDLIKAPTPSLVWAADMHLSRLNRPHSVRLADAKFVALLGRSGLFSLLEIKDPFVLHTFQRVEDTKRKWAWMNGIGRPGRQVIHSTHEDDETRWFRIGGRLSFISVSIAMTAREWTEKHVVGEFVSVLMFAGRYLDNEHGTARFLTLRRAQVSPERWERVGALYTIIPFAANCRHSADLFDKIPAKRQDRSLTIQRRP